jgi:hypothetical protein
MQKYKENVKGQRNVGKNLHGKGKTTTFAGKN